MLNRGSVNRSGEMAAEKDVGGRLSDVSFLAPVDSKETTMLSCLKHVCLLTF